jgi:hypothetical protein
MKLKSCFPLLILLVSLERRGLSQPGLFDNQSILNSLQSITATTIPSNGDLNPYGVAFVPAAFPAGGSIAPGDLLVANFNNNSNQQGTGTTIVRITATGSLSVFATSPLIGLDTALGVLSRGFVIVGNLPVTYPGGVATPHQGSLQIFNRHGALISTLNDSTFLDSPWDLTINDQGSQAQVFVSNVLSGTVTRLDLSITSTQVTVVSKTRIGSGYAHQPNAAAVVVGPTGLAYDPYRDTLYVASTADNEIFAIGDAGDRQQQCRYRLLGLSGSNPPARPSGTRARAERKSDYRQRRCGECGRHAECAGRIHATRASRGAIPDGRGRAGRSLRNRQHRFPGRYPLRLG